MQPSQKLKELVNDVEELLAELSDEHGPEVTELRDRLQVAIADARRRANEETQSTFARVREYAGSVDHYINRYPRLAVSTALLVAGTLGYLVGLTARVRE